MVYLLLDGDSIGDSFELLYLDEKIESAVTLSRSISDAISRLAVTLEAQGASIHIAAGDDVLATIPDELITSGALDSSIKEFLISTGHTLSGGVGDSLAQASENLRRAKLSGKNKVVSPPRV